MPLSYGAVAAFAASIWGAVLSLAAVPVYLSRLGIEAYGLIGLYVTIQAILQVLDLGIAPAISRELARSSTLGDFAEAKTLVRTLECIYWLMALVIAATFVIAARPVASDWLGPSRLDVVQVTEALMLMGAVIAARWPLAIYQNALVGLGRLFSISLVNAGMATISIFASVVCVVYGSPTLSALFATQAVVAALYTLTVQWLAWRALGGRSAAAFDPRSILRIWKFSLGMAGVTLTGVALTQLDKTLLSRLLPLASFGEYMLAATVVGGLGVVLAPLFSVIYPRLSALVANGQVDQLRVFYGRASRLLGVVFLPIVIALGVYATDVLRLWTGNVDTAARVGPMLTILCIGSAINGLMYFPYSLQLAHGRSRIPLAINAGLLVLLLPLVILLTNRYGGVGAAAAWAGLEIVYLALGTYVTNRCFPSVGNGWFIHGVALPLLLATSAASMLYPLVELAPPGSALKVALVVGSVLLSQAACAVAFRDIRSLVFRRGGARTIPVEPACTRPL